MKTNTTNSGVGGKKWPEIDTQFGGVIGRGVRFAGVIVTANNSAASVRVG